VGVDDVLGGRIGDHALVAFDRIGLLGRDEGGADIGEVGADDARGANGAAVGDGARQRDRPVEPLPRLRYERERRQRAGMAAGAGGDQNQAVGALLDRLVRELLIDHVVEHDAAPAVDGLVELLTRAERGDDHRHLVLLAKRHVVIEPVVRLVHDLVDRERRRRPLRMRLVISRELFLDPVQPFVEQFRRPRIQRRERADHAGLALGDDEVGHGDDEQRCPDHGKRQAALEQSRHGHWR
ncbi:hypothetical protein chiPu_0030698, partial [Chiloscyllium punctatum]|nr:hypothetical protein [Chiloscyllium punctatum]